jgi:hypothetical protein
MNPGGPVEEAGSTARSLIDALKAQPVVLALMVMIFGLLLFQFYALHGAGKFRETLINQVFQNTATIHEILKQRSVTCPDRTRWHRTPTLQPHPIGEKPPPVSDDPPKPATSGEHQ